MDKKSKEEQQMTPSSCSLSAPSPLTTIKDLSLVLEKNCTTMKDLHQIHAHLIKTGHIQQNSASSRLLAFCATSAVGDINYAYLLFSQVQNPNIFIWNTIIRGFSQSPRPEVAISLFIDMLTTSSIQPQRLTYPSLFKAYAQMGLAHDGAQLHGRVLKLGLQADPFIMNTIVYMYLNSGFCSEARKIFRVDNLDFDVVTWNSMIMGLAKNGEIDESRRLFDRMPSRSTVSWNSMISAYVRNMKLVEALDLFNQMQEKRIKPSEFTMVSLLNTSARLGSLKQGEWIHEYIKKNNMELNSIMITAIIDMYCKCGSTEKALEFFENSPSKGLSSWNSMILGLATNGREYEAIYLFSQLEFSNLKPDDVTFIGVLTACSHAGLVDKAKMYFTLMSKKYEIMPSIKHYNCMIGALGGVGLLEEAVELIRIMPPEPDAIIWTSLLSSCRKHGNIEMAQWVSQKMIELDPNESSSYVLMSNMFAGLGQFEEALGRRCLLKEKRIEKETGCSSIEVNGEVHEFVSGGRLHPQAQEIYALLDDWIQYYKNDECGLL